MGERNFTILVEGLLVYNTWSKYYRYAEVKMIFFKMVTFLSFWLCPVTTHFENSHNLKKKKLKCVKFGTKSTHFEKSVTGFVEIIDTFIRNK